MMFIHAAQKIIHALHVDDSAKAAICPINQRRTPLPRTISLNVSLDLYIGQ